MDPLDLLLHPVRLRIVHALRGDRMLTTSQLCALVPKASKATVYRHVEALADGGVLEVAEEHRVRGAVERGYRLRPERASLTVPTGEGGADSAQAHKDAYRRAFAVAMAALAAEFDGYLDRDDADPVADLVGLRQHALWLDRAELEGLIEDLRKAMAPRLENAPCAGRDRYLLSPILFPTERTDPADAAARPADGSD